MSETKFRLLVVLQFVISLASIATVFLPVGYSQELEAAYAAEPATWLTAGSGLSLVVVGLFLIAWLASQIGLVLFKRWGRTLSLYATLGEFALAPFQGPILSSALESTLLDTTMLLWGAILALAYFSTISNRFER
jgi:hypothetical protein